MRIIETHHRLFLLVSLSIMLMASPPLAGEYCTLEPEHASVEVCDGPDIDHLTCETITYLNWVLHCRPGGGGGGDVPPPGGGGGGGGGDLPPVDPPTDCDPVIAVSLDAIRGSNALGTASLVGTVSVYPPTYPVTVQADGPGLYGTTASGPGAFSFELSLDEVPLDSNNEYTITAYGAEGCPGGLIASSASGVIARERYHALAPSESSLYLYTIPVTLQQVQARISIEGVEVFDHFTSSPSGGSWPIPFTRTSQTTAVVEVPVTYDLDLVGATVPHTFTGYATYNSRLQMSDGSGWPADTETRKSFEGAGEYWYATSPTAGISKVSLVIFGADSDTAVGFPFSGAASTTAFFADGMPY